jgi:cytochrome c oxidase subunit 1
VQLLATPVLGLTVLLVAVERFAGFGIFDPARGGDPLLFQHLFWFYSHPAVYIMILPGLGVISEVVTCFSRNPPYGYKAIAYSSLGIAFIGFLVWGHHMFVSGQAVFTSGAFGFISMVVAIFSAAKVFSWVGTLYKGSIDFKSPMVFVFGFLFLFLFGGLTGAALGTVSLDVPWHGTYFIVGHFHLIMVGSAVMAFLAAVHYWFPLMWGRMFNERRAFIAAWMVFVGFVGTFMPMLLLGNAGAPRRYYQYAERYQHFNVLITCFAYLLAAGLGLALLNLIHGIFAGAEAGRNPWRSAGFEWLADCPPLPENFEGQPVVTPESDPYHYTLEEVSHVD